MERGALQRKGMDDDFLPDHTTAAALNAVLASSWPAAAPPARRRPEPPKPPPRRPSLAAWDVPPFALPTPSAAQRKELWASTGAGSRATTSAGASFNERAASGPTHGSDDDDEDECVFPLEGCHDAGVAAEQDQTGTRRAASGSSTRWWAWTATTSTCTMRATCPERTLTWTSGSRRASGPRGATAAAPAAARAGPAWARAPCCSRR
ncbi:unnamed protein product [Prorocentrum cordatum]|uniref:Uncharacterized protein n=1 Tax=Prorocentrum cordatum TaxID=2364126 RepID=A0ABN9XGP9_9DINO|nr:unnamed protein product [Polarella glacialis]